MTIQLRLATLLGAAAFLFGGVAAADEIYKVGGSVVSKAAINEASFEQVKYKLPGISVTQTLKADEIATIQWRSIRAHAREGKGLLENGKAKEAVAKLKSFEGEQVRKASDGFGHYLLGLAYVEYAKADPSQLAPAVTALKSSVDQLKAAKKFSFYLPHCTNLLGKAYIDSKQYDKAKTAYDSLQGYGKRWKVRAGLGGARVKLAQGDASAARDEYKRLMSSAGDAELKAEATLGYARAQLGQEQFKGAADTVRSKLLPWTSDRGRNPETATVRFNDLIVEAFLIWGDAERGMKGKENLEWALVRYLRAEATATQGTELGAESLYKAAEVSKELGLDTQAASLREELGQSYPNSSWSKK
ncbi:MAG: hypothetical protein AAF581_06425 [Planctomycetota bacterium]